MLKEPMPDENLEKKHPEFASPKETYCLFDKKTETLKVISELHVSTRVTK